jgi:hypothetical protein
MEKNFENMADGIIGMGPRSTWERIFVPDLFKPT